MIELLLIEILPPFVFADLGSEFRVLEQLKMMEGMWIPRKKSSGEFN